MKFTKMEGLGNDYVYINCFSEKVENPEKLAIAMSDRHFGVGSDGVILIKPSDKADFTMDMYNADVDNAKRLFHTSCYPLTINIHLFWFHISYSS